jgi:hypothetical protein
MAKVFISYTLASLAGIDALVSCKPGADCAMKFEPPETENERKMQALDSLARVLKNGLATASDRQRRLIQYLATEELEGRGDRLKAVSIATDVLGRSVDFDPQTDSIVRVEMGRMRKALNLYYATHGVNL